MNSIIKAASRLALRQVQNRIVLISPLANNRILNINKRWAHNAPLTYDFARERIMLVLHLYDKIDPNKLTLESRFVDDLGLDSLDHVDIIMQLEDEFNFEIPDKDAEKLLTPADIVKYITDKEEAYKELQDLEIADHHHHHHEHHHDVHHNLHVAHHDNHSHHLNTIGDQKREFSSWTAKRYYSALHDTEDYKLVWRTTFNEDPPTDIRIEDIHARVMKVLSKYDKIDSTKLNLASHFVDDLGLDSLDHVEIMMELEDEFGTEIPDTEAEKLMRPVEIARYIFQKEESNPATPEERPY